MKITILGSGTSTGVPQIGCTCEVCTSADPRDARLRTSALVEVGGMRILIDCGPDFRQQMLHVPFGRLDAVLLTHEHYDHVGGLDDLRPFGMFGDMDVYGDSLTVNDVRMRMPYCFAEQKYPGVPGIELHEVAPHRPFRVGEVEVMPIQVMHGRLPILGYRIGRMAYLTDMKSLPDSEWSYLEGVECLIVNGLRWEEHPTHQTIDEAVCVVERVGARQAYLIHLSHHAGLHAEAAGRLPEHVHLAYDGLTIELD